MNAGRPQTAILTYGTIGIRPRGRSYIATARYRDADGRLRLATASGASRSAAQARLEERMLNRAGYGNRGVLALTNSLMDQVGRHPMRPTNPTPCTQAGRWLLHADTH